MTVTDLGFNKKHNTCYKRCYLYIRSFFVSKRFSQNADWIKLQTVLKPFQFYPFFLPKGSTTARFTLHQSVAQPIRCSLNSPKPGYVVNEISYRKLKSIGFDLLHIHFDSWKVGIAYEGLF